MKRMATLALGALLAMALSACGNDAANDAPAVAEPVTAGRSRQSRRTSWPRTTQGTTSAFSRDLSLPAQLIVDEETFAEFRYENLPVTGPYMAITSVQAEPGRQDADHARYLVHARFEHQNAVTLLVTVSRSGEVDGLELYPIDG